MHTLIDNLVALKGLADANFRCCIEAAADMATTQSVAVSPASASTFGIPKHPSRPSPVGPPPSTTVAELVTHPSRPHKKQLAFLTVVVDTLSDMTNMEDTAFAGMPR